MAFRSLFDVPLLTAKFKEKFGGPHFNGAHIVVFGEAYGGKMQRMKDTYGDHLKFVAFEVKIGNSWLAVPQANDIATFLGLDFVPWREIDCTVEALDAERDRDSEQAVKNGCGTGHMREGIVIRPPFEVTCNNGERVIAKHKRAEFSEVKTPRPVDGGRMALLTKAEAIADEYVTAMRLGHVLDAFPDYDIRNTGAVIKAMCADIEREAEGEILKSKAATRAICRKTAQMFKSLLDSKLHESK